jgi:GDP-L-fucose synthase
MRIIVIGGTGFLGKNLQQKLDASYYGKGYDYADIHNADVVIFMATDVGGINYSSSHNFSQLLNNAKIGIDFFKKIDPQQRTIIIGSAGEYPQNITIPIKEDQIFDGPPIRTSEGYGIGKRLLWHLAKLAIEDLDANIAYLRFTNMYGPFDNFDLHTGHVIPNLLLKSYFNDEISIHTSSDVSRDFLFVDDAVSVILKMIDSDFKGDLNIGGGREITLKELTETINTVTGKNTNWKFDPQNMFGPQRRLLDITKARENISYEPSTSLLDGLKETYEYMREAVLP